MHFRIQVDIAAPLIAGRFFFHRACVLFYLEAVGEDCTFAA